MRLVYLALVFGAQVAFGFASFDQAKKDWKSVRADYDGKILEISQRMDAALKLVQDKIDAKTAERNLCRSLDCAKRCDVELAQLNQEYSGTAKPFSDEKYAASLQAMAAGRTLALNAYAEELQIYMQNEMHVTFLSVGVSPTCEGTYPVPGLDMDCYTSTLEFRIQNSFYKTKLTYGLSRSTGQGAVDAMDFLFGRKLADFLNNESIGNAECSLAGALKSQCHQNIALSYEKNVYTYRFYDYSRIGFISTDVQHSP